MEVLEISNDEKNLSNDIHKTDGSEKKTTVDNQSREHLLDMISSFKRYYLKEKVLPAFLQLDELLSLISNISVFDLSNMIFRDLGYSYMEFTSYFEKKNDKESKEILDNVLEKRDISLFKYEIWEIFANIFRFEYMIEKDIYLIGNVDKSVYLDYKKSMQQYILSNNNLFFYCYGEISLRNYQTTKDEIKLDLLVKYFPVYISIRDPSIWNQENQTIINCNLSNILIKFNNNEKYTTNKILVGEAIIGYKNNPYSIMKNIIVIKFKTEEDFLEFKQEIEDFLSGSDFNLILFLLRYFT